MTIYLSVHVIIRTYCDRRKYTASPLISSLLLHYEYVRRKYTASPLISSLLLHYEYDLAVRKGAKAH